MSKPLVPVAWEHLEKVRALLEHLEAQDSASVDGTKESRAKVVRKVFDRCSKPTQRLLLHLARHGGQVYGEELARAADPQGPTNVSPYMKSMNAAIKRYQLVPGLLELERDNDRLFLFKMRDEDAEIVRGFAAKTSDRRNNDEYAE